MQFREITRGALILFLSAIVCAACATTKKAPPGTKTSGKSIPLTYTFSENVDKEIGLSSSKCCPAEPRPTKKLVAEPAYYSKRPMYGVLQLGENKSQKIIMVADESRGTRSGYDTLYVDANGNLDLTDDAKLTAKPNANQEDKKAHFSLVELKAKYDDKELPYHVTIDNISEDSIHLHMNSACYAKGTITLGAKTYKVVFVDSNTNGLFNDHFLTPKGMGGNQVYASGDGFGIDLNGDDKFDMKQGQGTEVFPLGKYLSLGQKCYEIELAPSGRSYTLAKTKAKCGVIALEAQDATAILINSDGGLRVAGKNTTVPEGSYQLCSNRVEAKDGEGQLWQALGTGLAKQPPVVVTAKKTTPLAVGAPFTAEVTVSPNGGNVYAMSLSIKGQGGEVYAANSFQKVGKTDTNIQFSPKPKVKIVDKDGKEVATGDFEYG